MKCKFCGNESALVKAHIIPAGFFRRLRQGKEALELITNTAGEHVKKAHVGVYDRTIVCGKCESIWQEWDNYAQQLLAEPPLNGQPIYHNSQKVCYVVDQFEYVKVKLFLISMVWRASVSSHKFFSGISLGEYENIAKRHIVNNDPGGSEDFSVVITRFEHPLAKVTLDPYMYQNSGVNYARFYLASYIADIKLDPRPTPTPLSRFVMTRDSPLYVVCRDFRNSK